MKDNIRLEFISHWIWTIIYMLLAISGFAMMGARFGWMFGYKFELADFVHRIMGVLFLFLVLLVVVYMIRRLVQERTVKTTWSPIGKKGFAAFTFLTTLLIILSGVLLWFHPNIPYLYGTFGFIIHEVAALLSIGSVVWHIYKKRYILRDISKKTKRVK